jgi:hypothetical protein
MNPASNEQFERAWENAKAVSGLNAAWIAVLGETEAKEMAAHWWIKGFGSASGSMWWPDPSTYKDGKK